MRGGIFRKVFAGALVALLALALAACGGDDEGGATTSSQSASPEQGQGSAGKDAAPQIGKGGGNDSPAESGERAQAAPIEPAPLEVSGGGSDQFRVKGGDNSIQTWGEESDQAQLEAAATAVHGFYAARASEEWAEACEYLGAPILQQLQEFSTQAGKEPAPCPQMLKTLTRHPLPASVRRETTIVDAGSLRIGEDNSFLIYRGVDRTVFAMPLVEEDGAWKVTLLSPTTLG